MSKNTLSHFTFSANSSMHEDSLIFTIKENQLGETLYNEEYGIYLQSGANGSYVTVNYSLTGEYTSRGDFEDSTTQILQGDDMYPLPYNIVRHIKNKSTHETNRLVHFGIEIAYS